MEPDPVLLEAAGLLRPGGVFAAYDYDVPPVIHPEVDASFADHLAARRAARSGSTFKPERNRGPRRCISFGYARAAASGSPARSSATASTRPMPVESSAW